MTTTQNLTTEPVHIIAHTINNTQAAPKVKAFVQHDGTLRIVAQSVSAASIAIGRAFRATRLHETIIDRFEVRFRGTQDVATYPVTQPVYRNGQYVNPLNDKAWPEGTRFDRRTGAIVA